MRIAVHVKPKAREDSVTQIDERHFRVNVTAVPEHGKANEAVLTALAEFLSVPKTTLRIVSGANTRYKIIEVLDMRGSKQ